MLACLRREVLCQRRIARFALRREGAPWFTSVPMIMVAVGLCLAEARAGTPEIGDAVAVKNEVTVEAGDVSRKIETGSKVFQDEIVVTKEVSGAEIELLDQTKLAVGPSSRVVLDKFIYDANAAPGAISINMLKGAFRFITGSSNKTAYEIKTPSASMGVRGTVFDVFVADDGETAVLLHEGSIDVCPTPTTCQRHDRVCHIVHISSAGKVSKPARWDGGVLKGLSAMQAFPFVGRSLVIDPVRRLSHPALIAGTCDFAQNAPSPAEQHAHVTLPTPNAGPVIPPVFALVPFAAAPILISVFDRPASRD